MIQSLQNEKANTLTSIPCSAGTHTWACSQLPDPGMGAAPPMGCPKLSFQDVPLT